LLIQTPQFREGARYQSLVDEKDRFLEILKSDEHLYLFSQRSVTELCKRLGAEHIQFEPAIFAHYDMFLAVSRIPMKTNTTEEIESLLLATPAGRFTLALLDLRENLISFISKHDFDEYKENCISQINILTEWVHEARSEVKKLQDRKYFGCKSKLIKIINMLPSGIVSYLNKKHLCGQNKDIEK